MQCTKYDQPLHYSLARYINSRIIDIKCSLLHLRGGDYYLVVLIPIAIITCGNTGAGDDLMFQVKKPCSLFNVGPSRITMSKIPTPASGER